MPYRSTPDRSRGPTPPTFAPDPAVARVPQVAVSRTAAMGVRRALHAQLDGWLLAHRLRAAAQVVADDARRHGLRAEEMLVALEREWGGLLVRTRAARKTGGLRDFARRLVAACIHGFYAAARTAGAPCPVQACRAV